MVRELFALFNKEYRDAPNGALLRLLQSAFASKLAEIGNGSFPDHVFYADDCFVVFRNLGFRNQPEFERAIREAEVDPVLLGRLWRLWVVAWSLRNCLKLSGDAVDCGTYDGGALNVALRYSAYNSESFEHRRVFACDIFDNPPSEARKARHGPSLFKSVKDDLCWNPSVVVVPGELPMSLEPYGVEQVCWAQIDLNSALADRACFEYLRPRLVRGAMVVFDDYGFSRYKETQTALDVFASSFGAQILELPTGQGLYVHY